MKMKSFTLFRDSGMAEIQLHTFSTSTCTICSINVDIKPTLLCEVLYIHLYTVAHSLYRAVCVTTKWS